MTAVGDFFLSVQGQDANGRDSDDYRFSRDLVRRLTYVFLNSDDEEGEFHLNRLRTAMFDLQADIISIDPAYVRHLHEYLKEQA